VSLDAPKTANAVFAVYDKTEGELYSSYYPSSSPVKTIKIEKTNNNQVLDFKMTIGKKAFSKSFAANTSVVETINVTETSITKL
jgi:ribosome-associated toxin RatA of RatAB toxin-antitoxin module